MECGVLGRYYPLRLHLEGGGREGVGNLAMVSNTPKIHICLR